MSKIVIVIPYYERQYQLNKTLQTMAQSEHKDFSVVIVDDNSPNDIHLPSLPFQVEVIKLCERTWTNCGPVYNIGFNAALKKNPDIIMLQSPECYHVGDVISHADEYVEEDNYIAFGCFQIDKETTFKDHDILKLSQECYYKVDGENGGLGFTGWWNHPDIFPLPQYWCAAISARNMVKINGIDERFAHGYAYEDGWFVEQIKKMGLRIDITDYPFVVHQWHPREMPKNVPKLVEDNVALYKRLMRQPDYRSEHHITPDLQWSGN